MIEFTPYRNVELFQENLGLKIDVDSLRKIVNKSTLIKYLMQKDFTIKEIKSNSRVSASAKRMLWTKETTSLKQVITPRFKNIILTTPHHLNQASEYKKCNLIVFGLAQPKKPLHIEAQQELSLLFNKFGVDSHDLSIDTPYCINTGRLSDFGDLTNKYSTVYVNHPNFKHISKVCYYDKALKDNLPFPLYRLELTIQTKDKLQNMFIPTDELETIINHIWR